MKKETNDIKNLTSKFNNLKNFKKTPPPLGEKEITSG